MPSRNKIFLMGNLTRDVELRYTTNKTAVANFGLAVNRKWKGENGSVKESVCFIEVVAWGKQAEACAKYLEKGSLVDVEGRLDFETWDQDGQTRSKHKVTVEDIQFLPDGKKNREPGEGE